jgi:penicillin-binding protein 2
MDLSLVIIIVCAVLAVVLVILFFAFGRGEGAFTLDIGGGAPRAAGGSDSSAEKTFSGRLVGLGVFVSGVFAVLLAKLWSMQLISSDEYTQQAESNRTRTITTAAPRGRILDRNGVEIVTNRPSLTVVAESDVEDDEIEMTILGNLIGMPMQAVRRKIQDTSEGAQSARTVATDVSRRVVAYIGEHPAIFTDVSVQQRTQRSYPYGSLAAHVVGYTGTVTSDQLNSSSDDDGAVEYKSGDIVGQTGVETEYESVLQGIRGEQTVYVDSSGNVLETSTTIDPQSGSDLYLTLDVNIQQAAETSLATIIKHFADTGYECTGGCALAVDCTNGEVIALASYPTYEPARFVGGISSADWSAMSDESANYPLMNRAIAGQYPSGSTIKALSSFAGLDYGIVTTDSGFNCTGWWTGFGESYGMKCWVESGHGYVNMITGLTNSCDVIYYEIGKGFYYSDNSEGLQETFRKYGLGETTGIDLPGEASGRVPDAEWKWNYFSYLPDEQRKWQGGENCNIAIGQGDLLVTLAQMVQAYCSIANQGPVYKPHVMKSVRSRLGTGSVIDYKVSEVRNIEEDQAYRDVVKQGLYGVVYEESASQAIHWTNLDITVNGKTGTAQQGSKEDPIGWFIGYAPADNPRYVVGANVDGVLSGASSAMLIVRDIFGAIYGQPDDQGITEISGD